MEGANRPKDVSAETSGASSDVERYFARHTDALVDEAESFLAGGYREGTAGVKGVRSSHFPFLYDWPGAGGGA